jgi:asparagine synthase (glutamine-hydrolysing)
MCGIAAIWKQDSNNNKESILKAAKSMHHRGPNGIGVWINDDIGISLGHSRLSINDIEGGKQPMISSNNEIVIVVNGEFYDHREIRKSFLEEGYIFQSKSDSEIIIPLYMKYGTNCLKHLHGEFAFILFDLRNNTIFAARDRFGIKPLFYTIYKKGLYIASECKAFYSIGIPFYWSINGIYSCEIYMHSEDHSIFDNIKSIKPGHYILYNSINFEETCYWDVNYNRSKLNDISTQDIKNELRIKLVKSISRRLDTDSPVACYLSGGIDSSLITKLVSSIIGSNSKLETFTLSFDDPVYDEKNLANILVTQTNNITSNIINITNNLITDNFIDTVWSCENPIFNCASVAKYVLSNEVKNRGFKVVLTGEGADEVFGGYFSFREDVLTNTKSDIINSLKNNDQVSNGIYFTDTNILDTDISKFNKFIKKLIGYTPSQLKNAISRAYLFSDFKTDMFNLNDFLLFIKKYFMNSNKIKALNNLEILNKSLYIWQKSIFPYITLLQLGDRVEMANSIEARLPFLDVDVVEYTEIIPTHMKINGEIEKYILREVGRDILPDAIWKKRKHPFLSPCLIKKGESLYNLFGDYINSNLLRENPLYDTKKVREKFDSISKSNNNSAVESIFLHIVSTLIIQEKFRIN